MIDPVNTQQAGALQIDFEACLGLWHTVMGCTKPSNTAVIQRFQNKVLRNIVDGPWCVRNANLHRDLKTEMVTAEIRRFAWKHEERLLHYDNVEAILLLDNSELLRRLKRTETFELVS